MRRFVTRTQVITDRSEVDAVIPSWRSLCEAVGTAFQSPEFGLSWFDTLGRGEDARLAVVAAWSDDRLVALLPGCVLRRARLPMLTWLGGYSLVDFGGILVSGDPAPAVGAVLAAARRHLRGRGMFLQNVPDDGAAAAALRGELVALERARAPFYRLPSDPAQVPVRKSLAAQRRRLERRGDLRLERMAPDDPRLADTLRLFLRWKLERLEALGGDDSPLFRPEAPEFLYQQVRTNPWARLHGLWFDGELWACHIGYRDPTVFHYMLPAHDESHRKWSPGALLLTGLMQECAAADVEVFDFGVGEEPYKEEWADAARELTTYGGTAVVDRGFRWGRRLLRR